MKNKLTVLGIALCSVVAFSGSTSFAQAPPIVVMPPTQTANMTVAPPTCGGERSLKVSIDKPKDGRLSVFRLVGGATWFTDLVLTGKVINEANGLACSAAGVRITADEPEARAGLQACAAMAAAMTAGQRFYVATRSGEPAVASPGTTPRLTIRKAIQIDCGLE